MSDSPESPRSPPEKVESPPSPQGKAESPPSDPITHLQENHPDWVRDVVLWRRKRESVFVLLTATVVWVAMEIYDLRFVTLLSWLAMAFVVGLFALGIVTHFLQREYPEWLSRLEISEQKAADTANLFRHRINEATRTIFHVSMEGEWFVFAGVLASLYALSMVGSYLDLLTVCYIGVVGGLTVPLIYVKNEEKINEYGEKAKIQAERWNSSFWEKVHQIRYKLTEKQKVLTKEKKAE